MIYYLIPHGHGVCFHVLQAQSCPLALPQCHPQIHSLIVLLFPWATPELPALLLELWIPSATSPQSRPLSVTSAFLAGYFLILLKLVSIMHPGPRTRSSCAPPQMSSLSLCCQPPSLICMVTFFSLSLSSAAVGLHTSHVQDPSISINLWEELRLPSSESKLMLVL